MTVILDDHFCGNCGGVATHGLRMNGWKSMSIWMLVLMPTGNRLDAFLCRECLMTLTNVRQADGQDIRYAFRVPGTNADGKGKNGAMRQIKRLLGIQV